MSDEYGPTAANTSERAARPLTGAERVALVEEPKQTFRHTLEALTRTYPLPMLGLAFLAGAMFAGRRWRR